MICQTIAKSTIDMIVSRGRLEIIRLRGDLSKIGSSNGVAGLGSSGGIDDRFVRQLWMEAGGDGALERIPDALAFGGVPGWLGVEVPALGEHGFLQDAGRQLHG